MSNRESSSNKVLLSLCSSLMQNLQNTRLELSNKGDMLSGDSIFSSNTRNNDLSNLCTGIDGLMGKIEIEGHTGCSSGFFHGGECSAKGRSEAAKECSLHHVERIDGL